MKELTAKSWKAKGYRRPYVAMAEWEGNKIYKSGSAPMKKKNSVSFEIQLL